MKPPTKFLVETYRFSKPVSFNVLCGCLVRLNADNYRAHGRLRLPRVSKAIKSSVSTLGDKRVKEITSLETKAIFGFLKGRDKFACLLTGYGKSLIYHLVLRVAAELSVVYSYKDLFSTEPVVDESHCVCYW